MMVVISMRTILQEGEEDEDEEDEGEEDEDEEYEEHEEEEDDDGVGDRQSDQHENYCARRPQRWLMRRVVS